MGVFPQSRDESRDGKTRFSAVNVQSRQYTLSLRDVTAISPRHVIYLLCVITQMKPKQHG